MRSIILNANGTHVIRDVTGLEIDDETEQEAVMRIMRSTNGQPERREAELAALARKRTTK